MGRLPHGRKTTHIDVSYGPDADIMKFFSTSYSTSYNQDRFSPRTGKHVGTGYQSNFRPGVYYGQRIDVLDNPAMEKLVRKNYMSVTQKHFNPSQDSDGRDPLPINLTQVGSGFTRQDPITTPTVHTVRSVCIDTRDHGLGPAISGVLPKHRPFLHKLRSKDPVASENNAHGPGFMSTESKYHYSGTPNQRLDVSTKTVGKKEGSGYTHAHNDEPIKFHPGSSFSNKLPGYYTDRPTGVSLMKTAYLPSKYLQGDEKLPIVTHRSERETGFTHEKVRPLYVNRIMQEAYTTRDQVPSAVGNRLRKTDPAEYLNIIHPDNHSSISSKTFRGQQRQAPSEHERLGRFYIGDKELSGYSDNNDKPQAQLPIEPMRWITHYDTKFYDMNAKGKARAGRISGNVMDQLADGFTKSTAVHSYGPDLDTTAQLRQLHPYVARSIKASDVYYDSHIHDAKKHPLRLNASRLVASI